MTRLPKRRDDSEDSEVARRAPIISLLHATYFRESGPVEIKDVWLERADRPDLLEYIFAMDADDEATVLHTTGHRRVVGTPSTRVTAVRNWNAAATEAGGELLMVISDDLFPPRSWDTTLAALIEPLDPARASFTVKLADSPVEGDKLLRHPVVSREFYRRHGLFSPGYDGVYCDDDITTRAFWRAVILDGRSLVLSHRHPMADTSAVRSESQRRVNATEEYEHGYDLYVATWSRRQRSARIRLVPTAPSARLSTPVLRALRWRNWTSATVEYSLQRARAITTLISHPGKLWNRLSGHS
jgi:hypothetical protein